MSRVTATAIVASVALVVGACVKDPVTGKRQLVLIGESEEIAMGQQGSADVEASMGLYQDPELSAFVEELGQSMAQASERPHLPWQFRVVDSDVVNAFALPGGYVYLTRGILAYMNSEAALAGVLGHEIGHVTARHHVEQMSKQQLAGLGLNVGTVFFPEARPFGDILGGGVGLLFLKFGRDAERESDRLGVRYSLGQSYDPTEMAHFFAVLARLAGPERQVPSWASTHPDPQDRESTILALVSEQGAGRADLRTGAERYRRLTEDLVFGDNPREGFMRGSRFLHPDLEFQLEYPEGWKVQNTQTVVYAAAPDGGASMQLTVSLVPPGTAPEMHARDFFRQNKLEYSTGERLRVGPFSAYRAPFRALTRTGELYGEAGFVADGDHIYEILGLTRRNAIRRYAPVFQDVIESFDRLRDRSALEIQPWRIHWVQASGNVTLREALLEAGADSDRIDDLAVLNNLGLDAGLTEGQWIKVLERGSP